MSSQNNALSEGFKMTELGPLPEEWEAVRLDSIAEVKYGKANPKDTGQIPVVGSGGVFSSTNIPLVNDPTIVIGRKGTAGKVWLFLSPCYPSDTTFFLQWKRDIDVVFMFYFMTLNPLSGEHAKTTLPSLQKPYLESMVIPLPPLAEQKAIARVLSTIQKTVEAQDKIIAAARELKKSLMRHLFTYGPVPVAEAEKVPLKETEIGPVPEHWEVVRLGKITELITKGSSPNWQGFEYCDSGIVFLRSQNVGYGRLELEEIAHLPESFNQKEKKSIVRKNDLLINIVGASIGRAAVANEFIEGGNLNQAVALARLKSGLEPSFVMNFLLEDNGQEQLQKQKKEIARANLSLQDINNLIVPCPPVPEQQEIARMLSAVDEKIEAEEKRKAALQTLFKTMLHQLMTGKARVKEMETQVL